MPSLSVYHLSWVSLTFDVGYLFMAAPAKHIFCSLCLQFKGLDLIDRVPDELLMELHDILHETGIKTIPKKMMQKSKMAV